MSAPGPLTLGLEDELFLHSAADARLAPVAPAVFGPEHAVAAGTVKGEISDAQLEVTTPPGTRCGVLAEQLAELRALVARRAAARGVLVVPTGTPVLGDPAEQTVSDHPHYREITEHFRRLVREQHFSGLHVHVGVPDPAARAAGANAVRSWLPVLSAISTNSPFSFGDDTGYASWRTVNRARWPIGGVPPVWRSFDDYEQHVDELVGAGAAADRGGVYWDVRLSHRYPTVEVRIADTPLTVDEAVLVAALVRAAVARGSRPDGVRPGAAAPAPAVEAHLLHAAVFDAARHGLAARVVDPRDGRPTTADDLLDVLVKELAEELDRHGDTDLVVRGVAALRRDGTGADRQRAVAAEGGLVDVVRRAALSP